MKALIGATGTLGSLIAERMIGKGEKLRLLVRSNAARMEWERRGAEAVRGDLKDRESLDRLCDGVDIVITTATAAMRGGADTLQSVDIEGNRNLVDAAKAAGVGRIVFVSALGASPDSEIPLLRAKGVAEEYLKSSGVGYTILSPHILMEIWIRTVIGMPLHAGRPVKLEGEGSRIHSFVSICDVAQFAVAAAASERAHNRTLVLGGPDALSWREIIHECEVLAGRKIAIEILPAGTPYPYYDEPLASTFGGLLAGMEKQDVVVDTEALYKEFDIQPRRLRMYLEHVMESVPLPVGN